MYPLGEQAFFASMYIPFLVFSLDTTTWRCIYERWYTAEAFRGHVCVLRDTERCQEVGTGRKEWFINRYGMMLMTLVNSDDEMVECKTMVVMDHM
jgi:hypothetical protein